MSHFGARFGALIQRKREDRGWSFAQLALAAYGDDGKGGESRKGDVQKLEMGESRKPHAGTIRKYRIALTLTQDEIDTCRTPAEIELARYGAHLFDLIRGTVAQTAVSDDLASALAERFAAGNPDDFDTALRELQNAVQVAADSAAKGALPGNVDDAINDIIAEVDRLNKLGEIDDADALLQRELAQSRDAVAQKQAGHLRLIDKGIAQAVLARNVDRAVALELEKLTAEPGPDAFAALRAVQDVWLVRGRDKGLAFDLEVAIGLAEQSVVRATDDRQRSKALNDLSLALETLGQREIGKTRLEQAVAVCRKALEIRVREEAPYEWAMFQNNLGNALRNLGLRDSDTRQLKQAVDANQAALEILTPKHTPLPWAGTMVNMGNALRNLGMRETGTIRLKQAIAAYEAALKVYSLQKNPLEWAATQHNLGAALRNLGERETGTLRFKQAVSAYTEDLKVTTRETQPLDWAMTQNNLGIALQSIGEREIGTVQLEQAVIAFQGALEIRTREMVPLYWAETQNNLGNALLTIAKRKNCKFRLDEALNAYCSALEFVSLENAPIEWASIHFNMATTEQAKAEKPEGAVRIGHLTAALNHVAAALEVYDPVQTAFYFEKATRLHAELQAALDGAQGD